MRLSQVKMTFLRKTFIRLGQLFSRVGNPNLILVLYIFSSWFLPRLKGGFYGKIVSLIACRRVWGQKNHRLRNVPKAKKTWSKMDGLNFQPVKFKPAGISFNHVFSFPRLKGGSNEKIKCLCSIACYNSFELKRQLIRWHYSKTPNHSDSSMVKISQMRSFCLYSSYVDLILWDAK